MLETRGEKIFRIVNIAVLTLISIIALYPFVYVFSASISSPNDVITGKVLLFPKNITFESYSHILRDKSIWVAYGNTIYYTTIGTAVSLCLTICGAYPLSKKRLRGRKAFAFLVTLTMWFNAGMIPFYLTLRDLNLLNKRAAIIIAFACSAFNVILLRTGFESIPDEIEEAATVDGANDLQILIKIYLPLSKATIATIGLFYAVGRWNGYFWSMIIFRDESKVPLQVMLKKLIVETSMGSDYAVGLNLVAKYSVETIVYATIVASIIPILMVYPYIQKYFVKGVMVGAVKG